MNGAIVIEVEGEFSFRKDAKKTKRVLWFFQVPQKVCWTI